MADEKIIGIIDQLLADGDAAFANVLAAEMDCSDAPQSECVFTGNQHEYQYMNTDLRAIEITDTVIFKSAFQGCTKLQSVALPESLAEINDSAFYGCSSLEIVDMQHCQQLRWISNSAFQGCTNLRFVILPPNIDVIPVSAFHGCSSLEAIEIPGSVKVIAESAFRNCIRLQEVIFNPNGATELRIQQHAFERCGLREVTIPPHIIWLGPSVFKQCEYIREVTFPDVTAAAKGILNIPPEGFYECVRLESLQLGSCVRIIHKSAFSHCGQLRTSVVLPNTIRKVNVYAFHECQVVFDLTNFRGDGSQASLPMQCHRINIDIARKNLVGLNGQTKTIHSRIFYKKAGVHLNKLMTWKPMADFDIYMRECRRYEIWANENDVDKIPPLQVAYYPDQILYDIKGWMRRGADLNLLIDEQCEGATFLQRHKDEKDAYLFGTYLSYWEIKVPPLLEGPSTYFEGGQRVFSEEYGHGTIVATNPMAARGASVEVRFDIDRISEAGVPVPRMVPARTLKCDRVSSSTPPSLVNLSSIAQMLCSINIVEIKDTWLTVTYPPSAEELLTTAAATKTAQAAAKSAGNATQSDHSHAAGLHLMMRDLCC